MLISSLALPPARVQRLVRTACLAAKGTPPQLSIPVSIPPRGAARRPTDRDDPPTPAASRWKSGLAAYHATDAPQPLPDELASAER
jgi:hypothetical protein